MKMNKEILKGRISVCTSKTKVALSNPLTPLIFLFRRRKKRFLLEKEKSRSRIKINKKV